MLSLLLPCLVQTVPPAVADAELVIDLRANPVSFPVQPGDSDPSQLAEFEGGALFVASGADQHPTLWRLPATDAPFALTGAYTGAPQKLALLDGVAVVRAQPAFGARRLVRTDGTLDGTFALEDPDSGDRLRPLTGPVAAAGRAWFSTATEGVPFQVWSTDGTQAGTTREFQYQSGFEGSPALPLARYHPAAGGVFVALRQQAVPTLGFVAGSGADPVPLGRIESSQEPGELVSEAIEFLGALWFAADGPGGEGTELWRSDGTSAGTSLFADLTPGAGSSAPVFAGEDGQRLFLWATGSSGDLELWRTEGTVASTVPLTSLTGQTVTSGGQAEVPSAAFLADGRLVFGVGPRLWASDGTAAGTAVLASVPGIIGELEAVGSRVDFAVRRGSQVTELWTADGTAGGVQRLGELGGDEAADRLGVALGRLWFPGVSPEDGTELWSTQGTPASTGQFANLALDEETEDADPAGWVRLGGRGVFSGLGTGEGFQGDSRRIWTTDGTESGTVQLVDLPVGELDADPVLIGELGGRVLFVARTPELGRQLWATDGTPSGTVVLTDEPLAALGAPSSGYRPAGALLYFSATSAFGPFGPKSLWRTDGTPGGTFDLGATLPSVFVDGSAAGGEFVFVKGEPAVGEELWVSDGTPEGTRLLVDLEPGPEASAPSGFTTLKGIAYFDAQRSDVGRELFRTDGTAAGTELALDLVPGPGSSAIGARVAAGERLFFLFPADLGPRSLVATDGSPAGTVFLDSVVPELAGATPSEPLAAGRWVAFRDVPDPFSPEEVAADPVFWITDGQAAGTQRLQLAGESEFVVDLGAPWIPTADGEGAVFGAVNDAGGYELWWWRGLGQDPVLLADVHPGPGDSSPRLLGQLGGALFLAAREPVHGTELYRIDLTELGLFAADSIGSPCGSSATARIDFAGQLAPGATFDLTLEAAPPQQQALAFFDAGTALVPLGAGCVAYVADPKLLAVTATDTDGAASIAIGLSNDPGLSGVLATAQWLIAEPGGPLLGAFALSDALELVVGP